MELVKHDDEAATLNGVTVIKWTIANYCRNLGNLERPAFTSTRILSHRLSMSRVFPHARPRVAP